MHGYMHRYTGVGTQGPPSSCGLGSVVLAHRMGCAVRIAMLRWSVRAPPTPSARLMGGAPPKAGAGTSPPRARGGPYPAACPHPAWQPMAAHSLGSP